MKSSSLSRWALALAGFACLLPAIIACADTLYVATYFDNSIWQFDANGNRSLFAGPTIYGPQGMAYDQAGNLFVANSGNNTIEKFTTNGTASTFATDPGDNSVLNNPTGLAFDQAGNLYVANHDSNTIEKFTTNGVASVFADGSSDGSLNGPEGLAFDAGGNLFVANDYDFIEKFPPSGPPETFSYDTAYLNGPVGLAFDSHGNLYVANDLTPEYRPFIAKFDAAGNGSIFATNLLDQPMYLAIDKAGNLYVGNYGQSRNDVVKFTPAGAGSVFAVGWLSFPTGLAFDTNGDLTVGNDFGYLANFDTNGNFVSFIHSTVHNVAGLAVDSAGNVYAANSISGGNVEKFDTNGVPSVFASYYLPSYGIAVDGANNVYVAYDYGNQIYKYAPNGSGAVFTTNGLNMPESIAFDSLGNLFVVNSGTNPIVKINAAGQASVFATNASTSGTFGPGLAVDPANNVYVLGDFYGNTIVRYTPAGVPSNFADDPGMSYAQCNSQGMAFDSATNLYVANFYSGTIEKFDRSGNGTVFASGLNEPVAIAIRRTGNLVLHPVLTITRSGTNAVISWPLAANFNLKSVTNLASTNWLPVSGIIVTNGGNLVLTNPINGPIRFFRLSNP